MTGESEADKIVSASHACIAFNSESKGRENERIYQQIPVNRRHFARYNRTRGDAFPGLPFNARIRADDSADHDDDDRQLIAGRRLQIFFSSDGGNNMPKLKDGSVTGFHRKIGTIEYIAGVEKKFELDPQPNLIARYFLHLTLVVDTNKINLIPVAGAPYQIIRNLQIRTAAGVVLKNLSGQMLSLMNKYERWTDELNTIPPDAGGGATFEADLLIPLNDDSIYDPEQTILNSNNFTNLTLYITWGTPTDIFPTWTELTDTLTVDCDLIALYRLPIDAADQQLPRKNMVDIEQVRRVDVAGLTPVDFLLPEETFIKTIYILALARDVADPWTPYDVVLDNLEITDNNRAHVLRSLDAEHIQSINKMDYHIETIEPGFYVIEFARSGPCGAMSADYSMLYNTRNKNYPRLTMTVNPAIDKDEAKYLIVVRKIAIPHQVSP